MYHKTQMSEAHAVRWTVIIAAYFTILALLYGLYIPTFEAPDASSHFKYMHQIAETGELPIIGEDRSEAHQPPLYYLMAQPLMWFTTRSDLGDFTRFNRLAALGTISESNNNVRLHNLEYKGDTIIAIWAVRLYSIALSVATLFFIYHSARLALGSQRSALTSMLIITSMPTFIFISGSPNNDNLAALAGAMAIYWMLRVWMRRQITGRDLILLAVITPVTMLAKLNAVPLLGFIGLGLIIGSIRGRWGWRDALLAMGTAGASGLLLGGWWYVRNWQLYGHPLATPALEELWGRTPPTDPVIILNEAWGMWSSLWMRLGAFNIAGPDWYYVYVTVIGVLGLAGVIRAIWQREQRDTILLLGLASVMVIGAFIYATRTATVSQGRILFPMLAAFIPLLVLGWQQLIGRYAPLLVMPLAAMAMMTPFTILANAYERLQVVEAVPDSAIQIDAVAEGLHLLGYELLSGDQAEPDDRLRIALYVQGRHPEKLIMDVIAFDPYQQIDIGDISFFPGMTLTSQYDPDVIYRIRADLAIDASRLQDKRPRNLDLLINWRTVDNDDLGGGRTLSWENSAGEPIGWVRLDGPTLVQDGYQAPDPEVVLDINFGDEIVLEGYTLDEQDFQAGEQMPVVLYFDASRTPQDNYILTTGILRDGEVVTALDNAPAYYPTSDWVPGEPFVIMRSLQLPENLPAGTYQLYTGWYDQITGARLTIPDEQDPAQMDIYTLSMFEVPQPAQ